MAGLHNGRLVDLLRWYLQQDTASVVRQGKVELFFRLAREPAAQSGLPLPGFPAIRLKVRSSSGPRSQSSGRAARPSTQLHLTTTTRLDLNFPTPSHTMSTRKRKQDAEEEEELVALPSDESDEEEE
ncbi:hypothetical protein SVAN01_01415 [Stagonosporopsis vannaccii]|nr:hypothetical protein SVAN01_01415 [Stagonosporopsis vannaccii]